ncbi:MAG: ATP-binding protein [Limnobacter sp.]|nr:ATP-binding protein [Limnobacter sp.]
MTNLFLKILSLLSGHPLPSVEQWKNCSEQLDLLKAKNDNLENLIQRSRHQRQQDQSNLQAEHQSALDALGSRIGRLEQQIETLRERNQQLEIEIDLETKRQLTENQALLEQLNWLSGTIAHDFRAPLRAIDANSFFLKDDLGDAASEDALKTLSEISRNGKRMGVLIDGLLDYLRVGISPYSKTVTQPRTVLDRVVAEHFSLLEHPIEFEDEQGLLDREIEGDVDMLKWMFKELLDNAVKFSSHAKPRPVVCVRCTKPGVIEIVDNGVGFKEQHRAQLFQLFHRMHGNDEFPGEGIGLCIAKRIALRHQAELKLNRSDHETVASVHWPEGL